MRGQMEYSPMLIIINTLLRLRHGEENEQSCRSNTSRRHFERRKPQLDLQACWNRPGGVAEIHGRERHKTGNRGKASRGLGATTEL